MADGLLLGGRTELEALFDELAEELQADGATLEILMVGGSWLLWFGDRQATRDVDTAHRISLEAAAAIARVADRHDLDAYWINSSATPFLPADFDPDTAATALERPALTVLTPPAETIFLMKLDRASAQDREDMILLWNRCGFSTAEHVVEAYGSAYPNASDDPHLVNYVEQVISDAGS